MTWKKRIISIVLCLCALLCAASVRAEATDAATTHTNHLVCGGTTGTTCTHAGDKHTSSQTWTAWDGTDTIGNDFFKDSNTKYLYLSRDVEMSDKRTDTIVPEDKTLYLCLNGHSLTRKASNYTIYVEGTLVLCDCNGSKQGKGAISHGKEEDGSFCGTEGVYVMKNATFTMYGGKICNNNGGVLVSDGTFTMYGGEISHNTRTADTSSNSSGGGGVCVKKYWKGGQDIGKFYMYGGKICNNTYKGPNLGGGGVYASGTGDFIIQGGTITDNQCSYNGTNTSNGAFGGGGLHITGQHSSLEISNNTVISNNTCEGHGGGIFVIGGEGGSITNCTISGNSAAGKGGAICLMTRDANLTLSSGLKFSGNKDNCTVDTTTGSLTGGTANDVFLHTGAYLRLDSTFSRTTSTAPIVVTTFSAPTNSTVKIAEGSASVAKTTDFKYGNDSNSTIGIIAKTKADGTTVELLAHKHNYSQKTDSDNHWQECSICKDIKGVTAHSGGEASCTKKAVCRVCNQPYGELAAHDYDMTTWVSDANSHWHKCNNANCDAVKDKAEHTWNEGTVTTPATCTAAGVKTYTCTACSATKTEPVPATGHTPGAAVRENIVAATCTTAGSYDEVVYCMACRNEVSRTQKTIDKLAHDYDTTKWVKADENQHGHKCKNCDAITDLTAHVPGAAATETTPQLCTECGYVIAPATHPVHTWVFVAETPATCNAAGEREHYKCTCGRTSFKNGDAYKINEDASVLTIEKNSANHTGAPDSKWHSDSANHWQEYTCCHARANEAAHSGGAATCTAQAVCQVCGKAYGPLAAHDWGAWKVTTPATKDAPGVETRTCAHNSAHTETRSIPKLSTTVYTVSEDTKIAQIEAKVDGLDKILELNENKALVNDGKSVGVSLTVKNTASSGVSEKIKEKLAGSNLVGLRLELTVEKTVTANGVVEPKQTIHDAGVLLNTTITLPAELQGKSGYVVYRLHDGNVHVLTETANENGEFIYVSADKTQITICARLYSEYVIAYQTGGSSGGGYHPVNPTPVKATSANTGDAGVLLYGVTAALSLTGTAWLGAKSRKH